MNFDDAIRAHMNWKIRLENYLEKPDGSINATDLAKDNLCILGQWIYGEGSQYQDVDGYCELVEEHKKFHQEASQIVVRKQRGENISADISLGAASPFAKASARVVSLLMRLKMRVGANAGVSS